MLQEQQEQNNNCADFITFSNQLRFFNTDDRITVQDIQFTLRLFVRTRPIKHQVSNVSHQKLQLSPTIVPHSSTIYNIHFSLTQMVFVISILFWASFLPLNSVTTVYQLSDALLLETSAMRSNTCTKQMPGRSQKSPWSLRSINMYVWHVERKERRQFWTGWKKSSSLTLPLHTKPTGMWGLRSNNRLA